jgi:hypothetical protein
MRSSQGLLVVIVIAVGFLGFRWWQSRSVESELLAIPAYKALKEHDPATYDRIYAEIKKGVEGERSKAQVISAARKQVEEVVKERVPKASDESVVAYIDVTMRELDELYERGDETCHNFLFPPPGQALDVSQYVSKDLMKEDFEALARVIETSSTDPQDLPSEQEFTERLAPVFEAMQAEKGADMSVFANPQAPGVNKRKVCTVIRDLYDRILELPEEDASLVLRFMIANS